MVICEIFSSIDGEGIRTGYPVTFIRSVGCNLRCKYCDSTYSYVEDSTTRKMTVKEIIDEVKQLGNYRITFTGGEPLLQPDAFDLVKALLEEGFEVNIETNGSQSIRRYVDLRRSSSKYANLILTLDYKCNSSGMTPKMLPGNWALLESQDVIKFVVGSTEDLDQMNEWMHSWYTAGFPQVFVSPVFGDIEPRTIVEYLLKHKIQEARVQLQLHKFIWPPEKRGV